VRYYKTKEKPGGNPESSSITEAKFSKTIINVGPQKFHVPVKVEFAIRNFGKSNLYIQNVLPDCHCTVADFSKNPILPNDSSFVTLKYDASNPGPFQSSALVTTNSSSSPTLLVFRGVVQVQ
jgi:hypothetical protein